jgi:hypothetical protein
MAHYISHNFFDCSFYYMDNRGNSRANTCKKLRLLEGVYLLDKKPTQATALLGES